MAIVRQYSGITDPGRSADLHKDSSLLFSHGRLKALFSPGFLHHKFSQRFCISIKIMGIGFFIEDFSVAKSLTGIYLAAIDDLEKLARSETLPGATAKKIERIANYATFNAISFLKETGAGQTSSQSQDDLRIYREIVMPSLSVFTAPAETHCCKDAIPVNGNKGGNYSDHPFNSTEDYLSNIDLMRITLGLLEGCIKEYLTEIASMEINLESSRSSDILERQPGQSFKELCLQ